MAETNLKTELADIDSRVETLKKNIELGEALQKLHENEDFKKVILDGYMEDEAERIFKVLVDPSHNLKRDIMENLMDKLMAIRSIKQYFGTILINAAMAPEEIANEEKYRKEVTEQHASKESSEE
jgi:CheY-like chemotaxis protein